MDHYPVIRRGPEGDVPIQSVGDHAVLALKQLERGTAPAELPGTDFISRTALHTQEGTRWAFSPDLPRVPPDGDDTAAALLFRAATGNAVAREDLAQFADLQTSSGGLRTYYNWSRNEEDPVVNSLVAFLFLHADPKSSILDGMRTFLDRALGDLDPGKPVSPYYAGPSYFMLRCAKFAAYASGFFSDRSLTRLDESIGSFQPRDALAVAMTSTAASYRGLAGRARELNRTLRRFPWNFCTFYTQRTSPFAYGSPLHTRTFAEEALMLERDPSFIAKHTAFFREK